MYIIANPHNDPVMDQNAEFTDEGTEDQRI